MNKTTVQETNEIIEEIARQKQLPNFTNYTKDLKQAVTELRESLSCSQSALGIKLGISQGLISKWIKEYKTEKTVIGQIHGDTVRYDVPTKCMIVKRHIEEGIPGHKLADEYNVSRGTISGWNTRYKHNYNELIDAPEGTMVIGKEEKRVIGSENIKEIMKEKVKYAKKIRKLVLQMQDAGLDITEAEEKAYVQEQEAQALKLADEILNRK